jgi:Cytochrome c oxidase subunit IV
VKVEYKLFVILAAFFAPVGLVYGIATHWREPVGPAGLFLSAGLGAMIAFYLWATARRLPERPEDNPGGEIAEHEGEYGFFSPHSWWPLPLAVAAALCFLGVAIGWWLFIIGAALGIVALVGWTFEYFKGPFAV